MVTGAVGVAAYEALRKMVVKAPLRAATVSVTASTLNPVTRRLLDRDGFAGEHRLVDGGATGC